ncbi:hypothetical protein TNCT_272991 [Trichonephila clavata]|uniref:Uncharacterized protein n=1 Tax=Trichonephila clavata TaxID=2740835 RepID=A0A8X6H9X7_TRICU|nr:hypothetical protein TNCT_272991 [Trichonephila clavata]
MSETKFKAIVFVVPKIKKLLLCGEFFTKLIKNEKVIRNTFALAIKSFWANQMMEKAMLSWLIEKELEQKVGTMSLKVPVFVAYLAKFKNKMEAYLNERFY